MFLRKCTTSFSVTLLAFVLMARVCCVAASPRDSNPEILQADLGWSFSKVLALGDFDADDKTDQARVTGTGAWKSIEVSFSRTQSQTILRFRGEDSSNGALFANDIDNDGDLDLVWTDLLHTESVHVWENDGAGHFKSIPSERHARQFILSGSPAAGTSDRTNSENAVITPRSAPDFNYDSGFNPYVRIRLPDQRQSQFHPAFEARREPTDRGPPFLIMMRISFGQTIGLHQRPMADLQPTSF
jgi:hypothetical protein